MKKTIIIVVVIILIGVGVYFFTKGSSQNVVNQNQATTTSTTGSQENQVQNQVQGSGATTVIGKSVEGRDIIAYNYGNGSTTLLFIGGIHGGYESNTTLVAYQLTDYLKANPDIIPANIKVAVIPVLNPDGLVKIFGTTTPTMGFFSTDGANLGSGTIAGRFNANTVDLNRNFDCDWQSVAKWQSKTVSGGDSAFSEPESQAIKNYIEMNKPTAVIVWYSAAGGVYSSSCHNGVLPATNTLTQTYAKASGYPAYENFDFYAITGDMVNWFAKNNIPAISVLLTNHTDTESSKTQKGIEAVLKYYSK
jgi:hypothetical protein